MDMDELFSQVDEKRKVSMKIACYRLVFIHLSTNFPHLLLPTAWGLLFIPACFEHRTGKTLPDSSYPSITGLTDTTLRSHSSTQHTPTSHHHFMIVDIATREGESETAAQTTFYALVMAHFTWFNSDVLFCFGFFYSPHVSDLTFPVLLNWLREKCTYSIDRRLLFSD